jgi:hypothetical protein
VQYTIDILVLISLKTFHEVGGFEIMAFQRRYCWQEDVVVKVRKVWVQIVKTFFCFSLRKFLSMFIAVNA